ncbi:MAG: carboxymuconolactone decarboxylase family protein [Deltaproteobacteria bacterium]|nr:MAG: carboxymuconolactone decarboxylase family protein [Deltaproteobacteria bacterium]
MLSPEAARQAAAEAGVPGQAADLSIFRVLLNQPALARWIADLLFGLLFRGSLDTRLRELVILRLGWATGSVYEWTQHWRIATRLGIPAADLLAVRDWQTSTQLSEADRAVLAATDETLETGAISRDTWARCRRHVGGDAELLELVAAIGTWRLVSSVLRSLEVPLEEGVEPWPPDGRAPATG